MSHIFVILVSLDTHVDIQIERYTHTNMGGQAGRQADGYTLRDTCVCLKEIGRQLSKRTQTCRSIQQTQLI